MNKSRAVETPRKENQILLEGEKKASCRKWPWAALADRVDLCPHLPGLEGGKSLSKGSNGIQKTKITSFSPITSWQKEKGKVEAVTDFTFLGSKIIADGDCNHKIKGCLLLGRKAITNLDSIFKKQRHHSASKGLYIKAMVFPVVIYECESWTTKKAER